MFSERRIAVMTEEEVEEYLKADLEHTTKVSKYFRVTETANGTTNELITEEEMNEELNSGIQPYGASVTTTYKVLTIGSASKGSNQYLIDLYLVWKINPTIRSFDVIGIRTENASVVDGTQKGWQLYKRGSTGQDEYVNYSANGTNIKKASNGYGISMNLVDDGTRFENDTTATVKATGKNAMVYGSYQHAGANVTLAQSHAYVISHNGLGSVFNFSTSVDLVYDGMNGVNIPLSYS